MKTTILVISLFIVVFSKAQAPVEKGRVNIHVLDDQKLPVENATVELLRSKDSLLVKTALTDKNGLAEFDNLVFNTYILKITSLNYATRFTAAF